MADSPLQTPSHQLGSVVLHQAPSPTVVLIAGIATTVLAIYGSYLLPRGGFKMNIMGWYANFVIPIGPILVGIVAASGYGIASWFTGLKIRKGLLVAICALQLLAYFIAHYFEFLSLGLVLDDGTPVSFFDYYHFMTISMSYAPKRGVMGDPFGNWGYGFRFLEIAGFIGGSLIIPGVLLKAPYCDKCQIYMNKKMLAVFPASVPARKIKKKDVEGQAVYDREQAEAFKKGEAHVQALRDFAATDNADALRSYFAAVTNDQKTAKEIKALPLRIEVSLVSCKTCATGHFSPMIVSGQSNNTEWVTLQPIEIKPEIVREVRESSAP